MREPRAYLLRLVTRLALDQLRRVKARRETYTGPWPPEPLVTSPDAAGDPALDRVREISAVLNPGKLTALVPGKKCGLSGTHSSLLTL